jgi:glycine/D-amino acid oxidase-like deaminating enzyme
MRTLLSSVDEPAVIHIVGQGLAGSVLALRLNELGYRVRIHDNGYRTSSSVIAAGMWNPLSFVNLKRTWLADELIPELFSTYARFEEKLEASFFHPKPLLRIFPDAGAANLWEEKALHPEISPFIDPAVIPDTHNHYNQPYGNGVVEGAGWLDVAFFLEKTRMFFTRLESYEQNDVSTEEMLHWHEQGDWIIQCTGWKPMADSLWNQVPIHTNKGEILTVAIDGLDNSYMSNFSKFLIPLGKGEYRVGSTYQNGALDTEPSPAAQEIEDDLRRTVKHAFKVVHHHAGFRPTTLDRQPVLGLHNHYERLGIFNGLGSRGVLLAPYFANHLIRHLTSAAPIMKEVRWQRFEERRNRSNP